MLTSASTDDHLNRRDEIESMLQSLQVFRGLAAASVVLAHASVSTEAFVGGVPDALISAFQLGGGMA